MNIQAKMRIARPTHRMDEVVKFYRDGLGMDLLLRFTNHDGFNGVVLGHENAPFHLEFVANRDYHFPEQPPEDNLLIFFIPDRKDWEMAIQRMESFGYEATAAFNPYWDRHGKTFVDPDGYRVVLNNASWTL